MLEDRLTHRRVLYLAVPIVLSNITIPILGIVDTYVIARMGLAAPIGAVGLGSVIATTLLGVFGFLRMGTTGLTAQALGAGDKRAAAALLWRALIIGVLSGLFLIAMRAPLGVAALSFSNESPEVERLARDYLSIRMFGAPASLINFAIIGYLIAAERTGFVFFLQILVNLTNIVLDLIFVLGFGWDVKGVAWASVIAENTGALIAFCTVMPSIMAFRQKLSEILDPHPLWDLIKRNLDLMIRTIALMITLSAFLMYAARYGDVTLAASQILYQFILVASFGLDGFAFAAESLVGQSVGARSSERFKRAVTITAIWGLGIGLFATVIFLILGPFFIAAMTPAIEIQNEARRYLIWMALCPLISAPAWILDGIFIGAMRTRDLRNMMLLSSAIFFALMYWLMDFGATGLWIGFLIFFGMRGVTLASRLGAVTKSLKVASNRI